LKALNQTIQQNQTIIDQNKQLLIHQLGQQYLSKEQVEHEAEKKLIPQKKVNV
jgi:hypothetical protein